MRVPGIAIGLMCKPPRVGVSKTRLAQHIGADMAARLAAAFLEDVAATVERAVRDTGATPYALYTPADAEAELQAFVPGAFTFMLQHGDGLGLRMHGALRDLLGLGHQGALLVGSDLPTLPPRILVEAVSALRQPVDRIVIGPAHDGGYYLIGMREPHIEVFENMVWSTPAVFAVTLERARAAGLPVHVLPEWYDVDGAASFAHLCAELSASANDEPGMAPATRRVIAEQAAGTGDR